MEVNARVNYPIKNALRHMEQQGIIDTELEDTKFYTSSVALRVARVGMRQTVQAWNHHPIPGKYLASHPARIFNKNKTPYCKSEFCSSLLKAVTEFLVNILNRENS